MTFYFVKSAFCSCLHFNTCEKDWSLSPFLHYIWMSPIFLQPFIDLLFLYIGSYDAFLVMMLGEEKTKHLLVVRSRQDKKKWKCYSLRQLDEKKKHIDRRSALIHIICNALHWQYRDFHYGCAYLWLWLIHILCKFQLCSMCELKGTSLMIFFRPRNQ